MNGYFDKLDPSLFGISCIPLMGCTAVGAQAEGNDSVTLAQSEMGTTSAAARLAVADSDRSLARDGANALVAAEHFRDCRTFDRLHVGIRVYHVSCATS